MIIGLASPRIASSIGDGLARVKRLMADAASRGAKIVCFPEAYLPGLRGQDFDVSPFEKSDEDRVLRTVGEWARELTIATIIGIEHVTPTGNQIAAAVFDANGTLVGMQIKTQLDPTEEPRYIPGTARQVFEVNGLVFGIAICHEGWRYPETVRWAAARGAKVVFHPQLTGSDKTGPRLIKFGSPDAPYYEKAMVCRSIENTIYFASVNYATRFQESATALIAPNGDMQAFLPYGEEGVLVAEIDLEAATGLLASRFAPNRY
jgi:predicted amidohydrolase